MLFRNTAVLSALTSGHLVNASGTCRLVANPSNEGSYGYWGPPGEIPYSSSSSSLPSKDSPWSVSPEWCKAHGISSNQAPRLADGSPAVIDGRVYDGKSWWSFGDDHPFIPDTWNSSMSEGGYGQDAGGPHSEGDKEYSYDGDDSRANVPAVDKASHAAKASSIPPWKATPVAVPQGYSLHTSFSEHPQPAYQSHSVNAHSHETTLSVRNSADMPASRISEPISMPFVSPSSIPSRHVESSVSISFPANRASLSLAHRGSPSSSELHHASPSSQAHHASSSTAHAGPSASSLSRQLSSSSMSYSIAPSSSSHATSSAPASSSSIVAPPIENPCPSGDFALLNTLGVPPVYATTKNDFYFTNRARLITFDDADTLDSADRFSFTRDTAGNCRLTSSAFAGWLSSVSDDIEREFTDPHFVRLALPGVLGEGPTKESIVICQSVALVLQCSVKDSAGDGVQRNLKINNGDLYLTGVTLDVLEVIALVPFV